MSKWVANAPWRLGAAHTLGIGAASASTSGLAQHTDAVMIVATADCHIRITADAAPAVVTDTLIRAGWQPLLFRITQGENVSVIQDSAAGSLYVTELTH